MADADKDKEPKSPAEHSEQTVEQAQADLLSGLKSPRITGDNDDDPDVILARALHSKSGYAGRVTLSYNSFKDCIESNDLDKAFSVASEFNEAFNKYWNSHTHYQSLCNKYNKKDKYEKAEETYKEMVTKKSVIRETMLKLSQDSSMPESPGIPSSRSVVSASASASGIAIGESAFSTLTSSKSNTSKRSKSSKGTSRTSMITKVAAATAEMKKLEAEMSGMQRMSVLHTQADELEKQQNELEKQKQELERQKKLLDSATKLRALDAYTKELNKHLSGSDAGSIKLEPAKKAPIVSPSIVKPEPKDIPIHPSEVKMEPKELKPEVSPIVKPIITPDGDIHWSHMKLCAACGRYFTPDSKFCSQCGGDLESRTKKCVKCTKMMFPSTKFCAECGSPQDKTTSHTARSTKVIDSSKVHTTHVTTPVTTTSEVATTSSASGGVDVTSALVDMIVLSQTDMQKFNGDHTKFSSWYQQFNSNIHGSSMNAEVKLSRLLKCVVGEPLELISHCAITGGTTGYQEARDLLERRYGDHNRIVKSWLDKIIKGPTVSFNDKKAIIKYSDEIQACHATLKSLGKLNDVGNSDRITDVAMRLPYQIRLKWLFKATEIEIKEGHDPTFTDYCEFVKIEARARSNPLFENLLDGSQPKKGAQTVNDHSQQNQRSPNTSTSTVLHAQVATNTSSSNQTSSNTQERKFFCFLCHGNDHYLINCVDFNKLSSEERLKFARSHSLCFNCLAPKHGYARCNSKAKCDKCDKFHCSLLHDGLVELSDQRQQ